MILIGTRCHEDDLIGRCLQQQHENWTHIDLPAIEDGKALWPEWYPLEALEQIRMTLTPRDWQALYQGNPQPETGTYFQREWFRYYDQAPARRWVYITTDFGVSVDGDFIELAMWAVAAEDNLHLVWITRTADKAAMAQSFRVRCSMGKVFFRRPIGRSG